MCGIAGLIGDDGTRARGLVERQLRLLDHRGPDSWGVFGTAGSVVGQTRLSVIDLVTGDPPITNEDGTIGAVCNGEIYNFAALREELVAAGHRLSTTGDTEVLAHLAEDHDPVALARRLDGMFAFAVWDERRQRLVLGRDRLGKKPLYWWYERGRLVFGTEIKAVLADPEVRHELDDEAVPAYLTFGYVPTPRTFYRGIQSLRPGHVLVLEAGGEPRVEEYWKLALPGAGGPPAIDVSLDEAAVEVRRLLRDAVARRLVADVPLGAFLSGGVDSSAVVGVMAELAAGPVHTFTVGFEGHTGFDERPYAAAVARRFGTEHTEFVVRPEAVGLVEQLLHHHDQPFADSSALPTYLLCEQTRGHVTVALSGDGGDETFAGYERFAAALLAERTNKLPASILRGARAATGRFSRKGLRGRVGSVQRFLDAADQPAPRALLEFVAPLSSAWRACLVGRADNWGVDDYDRIWTSTAGGRTLDRLQHLNISTYLLDDLLPKADRMSMAHALEVRSPLLDTALVEFALRLPPSARLQGPSRKRVLKRAVADLLPEDILGRRKRGFALPLNEWFRAELRPYLDATVGARDASVRKHVDGDALDRLLAEHQSGAADHRDALWALLTLEVFLRREGW